MASTMLSARRFAIALTTAFALGVPAIASAHDGNGNWPCAQDVKTFCPDASSHEEVHQCLRQHADQLSAECTAKIQARHEKFAAIHAACESDLNALCPEAQGPEIRDCLHEHRDQLSDGCSQALQSMHKHHCQDQTNG